MLILTVFLMSVFFPQSGVIRIGADIYFLEPVVAEEATPLPARELTPSAGQAPASGASGRRVSLRYNTPATLNTSTNTQQWSRHKPNSQLHPTTLTDLSSNDIDDQFDLAEVDEDLTDEESYLPAKRFTIFGESLESHLTSPPRLHRFRRAGVDNPLTAKSRSKRSTPSTEHGYEPISDRTHNENNSFDNFIHDSESVGDFNEAKILSDMRMADNLGSSGQQTNDNLHVCDTTGEWPYICLSCYWSSVLVIIIIIIIIYHDFLPTPRRGSHVKSGKTHTQSSRYTP